MGNAALFDLGLKIVIIASLAMWLYRDSRRRDYYWLMWTIAPIMLFFLSGPAWLFGAFLILAVYLGLRPRGILSPCPHCQKKIHDELAFCPFCRRSVKRECLKCHRTVPWDATCCPHCRSSALTDS